MTLERDHLLRNQIEMCAFCVEEVRHCVQAGGGGGWCRQLAEPSCFLQYAQCSARHTHTASTVVVATVMEGPLK